jgi:hypothetical protein
MPRCHFLHSDKTEEGTMDILHSALDMKDMMGMMEPGGSLGKKD